MRLSDFFNLISILIVGYFRFGKASTDIYVCEASDPILLGQYSQSKEIDGVPTFSNSNEVSFYRNKGFWYIGNLGPWPPETFYRCVEPEGCNFNLAVPPASTEGDWKPAKKYAASSLPLISHSPCTVTDKEL